MNLGGCLSHGDVIACAVVTRMHEVIRAKSHSIYALEQRLCETELSLRSCENEKRLLHAELLKSTCAVTEMAGVERGSE